MTYYQSFHATFVFVHPFRDPPNCKNTCSKSLVI
nr:MAG TPA: hypothetical protein [Caudoviricetes sp.]